MPNGLRIEVWRSSEAREEVHIFVDGTQNYVIGFNPALIDESKIMTFLAEQLTDILSGSDNG